jgi:hypothetical protein
MVPRMAMGYSAGSPTVRRPGVPAAGIAGAATRTTPEQFLAAVGSASAFWERLLQFLDGLPGKFFWGTKGFSYRLVYDDKQYSVVWGYPRTVWWLEGKNWGDELRILTRPPADWPEALCARVKAQADTFRSIQGAEEQPEGLKKLVVLYVNDSLPEQAERTIRGALTTLFNPGLANRSGEPTA